MDSTRRRTEADFQFGRSIGEGSFSTVYVAREIDTRKEFAIKVCVKSHIIRERKQEYVSREKHALQKLKGVRGVIELFFTFQSPTKLFFVVTLARNGDLLKYIQQTGKLRPECAQFYAAELLTAIEGMHGKSVIHRDLKPENLLLDQRMHLLVADFGSAKILPDDYDYHALQAEIEHARSVEDDEEEEDDEEIVEPPKVARRSSFVGTAQYVSPEVLNGDAAHPATDLFAFGSIVYQMLSGKFAFNAPNEYLTFQRILKLSYAFTEDFTADSKDLIEKLLLLKPEQRLGATDPKDSLYVSIRSHPFFLGVDFGHLFDSTPPPFVEE